MSRTKSVRRKVTFAVFAAIGVSLALCAAGLGIYEYKAAETRLRSSLETLSDALLASVVSAVDFGVPEAAQEALGRVQRGEMVTAAALFRLTPGEGPALFADFRRAGRAGRFTLMVRPDGFYLDGDSALLVTTFYRDGRAVASLQLEGSLASVRRGLGESLRVLAWVFVVLLVVGAVLSRFLERAITVPIMRLADTARAVRTSENYTLRAEIAEDDELGQLGRQFNEMLAGIAARDQEIVASHALQRAILAGAGAAVISCRPDGVVRSFNPAAGRLLGYAAGEVEGRLTPVLWHDEAEIAARAQELTRRLRRPVAPGFEVFVASIPEGGSDGREWTFVRKDGSRVSAYLVISELRGAEGALLGYVGLATDLSDRRAAEEALRASEHRYSVVVDQTGQMVYDLDVRSGVNLWFGASAVYTITGYTLEEFQAVTLQGWSDMIHPDDRMLAVAEFDRCCGAGLRYDAVYRFRRKDGSYRIIQDFGVFLREADGRVGRMLGAMADVTERIEAEAAIRRLNADLEVRVSERTAELARRVAEVERLNAEQRDLMRNLTTSEHAADRAAARLQEANSNLLAANQELEAFSYSVSHDLRAPLRNITGFIELLARRSAGRLDAESNRFLTVVTAEATRMGGLIDDLLTFSRIGRTEMTTGPVWLDTLIAEVREELQAEIAERAINWKIGPLPAVRGDRSLLRQVIANLVGNAVKFTRQRPAAEIEIGLSAGRPGDATLTFYVRDNGAGFNPKYLDKLFGVFQRLHNARDFEGTGIGLANVKRIVNRHGGRVWAEGAVDRGATFYFTLPPAEGSKP